MTWQIREGDCRDVLRTLPEQSVQTCVTSPPYFALRDYGADGQRGAEATPDEFVAALVEDFRHVRRALRDDGTVWLNLGDSYAAAAGFRSSGDGGPALVGTAQYDRAAANRARQPPPGVKAKDLLGIPWMVAFALRADGWYLRSDIIWSKPNPMPESVTDRPTKAHEQLFLLSKRPSYFYDADAIREPGDDHVGRAGSFARSGAVSSHVLPGQTAAEHRADRTDRVPSGRNKRSVWTVATQPFSARALAGDTVDHFATFPPKLIEPCILAGSREGDTVLDPFSGAGTTGLVALRHNRSYIGCELNPDYAELSRRRITADAPLLNSVLEVA